MKIIFATNNIHKAKELRSLLANYNMNQEIHLLTLNDLPDIKEIKETGSTFTENAMIKAEKVYSLTKLPTLADDSGLEVEYLNNRPGIYSKRYAGKNADDNDRINKLLKELNNVPPYKRKARFVCSMVLIDKKTTFKLMGFCNGYITEKSKGTNGFGYDPVFFLPDLNKTMAQLSPKQKNTISHRANALKRIKEILVQSYKL